MSTNTTFLSRSEEATDDWLYVPSFPAHWRRRPLYSMARWVNGLAFRDIQFSSTGQPVVKIAEIKGGVSGQTRFTDQTFDDSVRVRSGDLLFAWSGQPESSINAYLWRGPEGWLNQHVFRVTACDSVDPTFLFYLLRYLRPRFVAIAQNKQTTGLGHVTKRDLERMLAASPSLDEQRLIARVLGTLDDKIELNRRTNETLEAMARELFKSWFEDFDPVRAKTAGRATGLPAHVADLFPDALDEDQVPRGWSLGTLTTLAEVNPESWSAHNVPGEVEYVDLANTKWGVIEATQRFAWGDAPSRARRILRPGDTIVGTVRPGNGSFAFIGAEGLTGSTGFAVLRPREYRHRAFVFLAATAPDNVERLAHLADGGAYPAVRPQVVGETQAAVPDDAIMDAFARLASPMLEQMESNRWQNDVLVRTCDLLLPKLISGEIRVPDAGAVAADAERAVEMLA